MEEFFLMMKILDTKWSEILALLTLIGIPLSIIWNNRRNIIKWCKAKCKNIATKYKNIKAKIVDCWNIEALKQQHKEELAKKDGEIGYWKAKFDCHEKRITYKLQQQLTDDAIDELFYQTDSAYQYMEKLNSTFHNIDNFITIHIMDTYYLLCWEGIPIHKIKFQPNANHEAFLKYYHNGTINVAMLLLAYKTTQETLTFAQL